MTEPTPLVVRSRDPQWVAATIKPGPNGRMFNDAVDLLAAADLPAGLVSMFDSTNAVLLPVGAPAYAGYYNGSFANLSQVKDRFPDAEIVSVTPNGQAPAKSWPQGAMFIDIEPGNVDALAVVSFIRGGGLGFYASPGAAGFSVGECIDHLSAAGIARSDYVVWSAHWIGRHICGPAVCGYPQADGTQYVSTAGWDETVAASPVFFGKEVVVPPTPPTPPPPPAMPLWERMIFAHLPTPVGAGARDLGGHTWVQQVQRLAAVAGPRPTLPDGVYGPETRASVEAVQKAHGLQVTGTVGSLTWEVLATGKAGGILPTVAAGSSLAEIVRRIQVLCIVQGQNIPVDGSFGSETKAAVQRVQAKYLPYNQRDGIVGPVTWSCLLAHRHP